MQSSLIIQVLSVKHLKAIGALPRVKVLDLRSMDWAEDAISTGLTPLVANLPCLRILDVPDRVLVRQQSKQPCSLACAMLNWRHGLICHTHTLTQYVTFTSGSRTLAHFALLRTCAMCLQLLLTPELQAHQVWTCENLWD